MSAVRAGSWRERRDGGTRAGARSPAIGRLRGGGGLLGGAEPWPVHTFNFKSAAAVTPDLMSYEERAGLLSSQVRVEIKRTQDSTN